jgi:hypothetical protein
LWHRDLGLTPLAYRCLYCHIDEQDCVIFQFRHFTYKSLQIRVLPEKAQLGSRVATVDSALGVYAVTDWRICHV